MKLRSRYGIRALKDRKGYDRKYYRANRKKILRRHVQKYKSERALLQQVVDEIQQKAQAGTLGGEPHVLTEQTGSPAPSSALRPLDL
jgi:hypothetical protein